MQFSRTIIFAVYVKFGVGYTLFFPTSPMGRIWGSVYSLRIADLDVFTESTMDFRVSAVKVWMSIVGW